MKKRVLITAVLAATLVAGVSVADDDCQDPVAEWQPKKVLREQLEAEGWEVQRIKVDDGCYEVKGIDPQGNKVKAEYYPATLLLRKIEMKFEEKDAVKNPPQRHKNGLKLHQQGQPQSPITDGETP